VILHLYISFNVCAFTIEHESAQSMVGRVSIPRIAREVERLWIPSVRAHRKHSMPYPIMQRELITGLYNNSLYLPPIADEKKSLGPVDSRNSPT